MSGTRHRASRCKRADPNRTPIPARYLITIVGSAGAFPALWELLSALPSDLPAAVAVMLHTGPGSLLASTLAMRSRLAVREARSGDLLTDSRVHVASGGRHLIVNPDARLTVSDAPRVRFCRPSADWLFESAAASFGGRHMAIVLSGMMSDGARQLRSVKRLGGSVLVQAPAEASFPGMPLAAIDTGAVDAVLRIAEMPHAIGRALAARDWAMESIEWEDPFSEEVLAPPPPRYGRERAEGGRPIGLAPVP